MGTLLKLDGISKSYSGVRVLENINVELSAGEVLCLAGENGAGKSTLIKIISGVTQPDEGTIRYFGKPYERMHPKQVMGMGVMTIYQDADLIDSLTVSDNIFLGQEIRNRFGLINSKEQNRQTAQLLEELDLTAIKPNMVLESLSTAQKQCVQIIKALKNKAKVLILDEPTASLGDKETKILLGLIKDLARNGIGIIYISHFIDELFEIGDTLLVLKDGHQVAIRRKNDTNVEQIIHDMIGRDASSYYSREHFEIGKRTLTIEHYENTHTVHDVSLKIHSGEIFGLGGLVGAGRTELARMIYGADPKRRGRLYINELEITPKSPKDAIQKGVFMISEDRKGEGLLSGRSVKENITLTHTEEKAFINLKDEENRTESSIHEFKIKTRSLDETIANLSGGNQQKAVIARAVMDLGDVYIFDEPTKGVDVGAKEEIYGHILKLAKQDKFIILISSEMPELISMSDRIGIMREGHLEAIINSDEATEDILMKKYLGKV